MHQLIDEEALGVAFEMHRAIKLGYYELVYPDDRYTTVRERLYSHFFVTSLYLLYISPGPPISSHSSYEKHGENTYTSCRDTSAINLSLYIMIRV